MQQKPRTRLTPTQRHVPRCRRADIWQRQEDRQQACACMAGDRQVMDQEGCMQPVQMTVVFSAFHAAEFRSPTCM